MILLIHMTFSVVHWQYSVLKYQRPKDLEELKLVIFFRMERGLECLEDNLNLIRIIKNKTYFLQVSLFRFA